MREKEFFPRVRLHFDYLTDEFGFEHENSSEWRVHYSSPNLHVAVWYFPPDRATITQVWVPPNEPPPSVDLGSVYVAAGLGPAQDVRTSAQTMHAMNKSLKSQADALRAVIPLLRGPDSADLIHRSQQF
jgi:hypothetical protein